MKKINLDKLVSIAEIISSIAIIISLFYAAYEFNRSKTLTNRDVENILYERMLKIDQMIIENKDLAKLVVKASISTDELTTDEKMRYLAFEHVFYDSWESAWYYYSEGILEKSNWDSWNSWFKSEAINKPSLSWQGNRRNYNGKFLEYIDNVFSKKHK